MIVFEALKQLINKESEPRKPIGFKTNKSATKEKS